jgi:hypothetical protein
MLTGIKSIRAQQVFCEIRWGGEEVIVDAAVGEGGRVRNVN